MWEWGGLGSASIRGTLEEKQGPLASNRALYDPQSAGSLFIFFVASFVVVAMCCAMRAAAVGSPAAAAAASGRSAAPALALI